MTGDHTVLVVDDEQEITETYSELLDDRYTVEVANSGEQALEILSEGIDVVLLDRRMPGMSGDELLEAIRAEGFDCRVVMITAVDPDTNIIGMEFDEYLVKPVSEQQLHEVVDRMLTRDHLDQQIQRMVSVASRLATLESKLDYEQLERSDEYESLRAEFDTLRAEVTLPEETDDEYVHATIEKLDALLSERQ
jgi:CheY-like chemotaxis protein